MSHHQTEPQTHTNQQPTPAQVRVRFAPSPTGYLHIGGARTALFNWIYARAQKGVFILRIEDTDQERSKQEYLDEILDSLRWLGLEWDEFYRQSERFEIYRRYAQQLLEEDKARREGEAVILPVAPSEEAIVVHDIIRGTITFDTGLIKDQVLIKSDGTPTYSFACVVDDALMRISHVIRGEDHISNTPKQILIARALGFKPPKYAHLPLILDPAGGRMSKRTGAVAVSEYQRMGFLPQALVNYLLLLGWSPGGQSEIVSLDEAVKRFSLKKVNKAGAAFNMDKLRWINSQYIKKTDPEVLLKMLEPRLKEKGWLTPTTDQAWLREMVRLYQGRMSTLEDFFDWCAYAFEDHLTIAQEDREQYLTQDKKPWFEALAQALEGIEDFKAPHIEKVFREVVARLGIKAADLVHPVRVALTGKTVGPGLFETMAVLGKDKTIKRLRGAFAGMPAKS